jgi:hypothetical protein
MTPELVWSLDAEHPELLSQLPPDTFPLDFDPPARLTPFREGARIRPPGHRRTYYDLRGHSVIAWKGTEPISAEYPAWVSDMAAQRLHVEVTFGPIMRDVLTSRAELRALDKWSLVEGKVPGGYTVREGLAEARAAARYQRVHLERYGELARIPLPLAVYRWPDEVQRRAEAALRPHLSPRVGAIEPLGGYVYAYPSVPLRLLELTLRDVQPGFGYHARLAALPPELAPRQLVERWITLVARMLASGFVPKDPTAVMTGDCLQPQNVVLDGGVADVESLVPTAELDERALADALRRTLAELTSSIVRLLFGTPTPQVRERLPDLGVHVWREVARHVVADRVVDQRVATLLEPATAWDGLDRLLSLI